MRGDDGGDEGVGMVRMIKRVGDSGVGGDDVEDW